ncbi:MAG: septum formation protein Maf [Flavobacteriales bacterium]|nr:septum formation protein Maf [Flavobacteriales bacterium]
MLVDILKNKKIILGSASPRRKELLKSLGVDFKIRVAKAEERFPKNLQKEKISEFLALQKAKELLLELKENEILITADTIVIKDEKILNKPKDESEAFEMLSFLSDDVHEVITSVCLLNTHKKEVFSSSTKVFFKNLSNTEINFYIENYKPFDKAGAYGIQEWIGQIGIEKIDGSYSNVVGLPIAKLYQKIIQFVS